MKEYYEAFQRHRGKPLAVVLSVLLTLAMILTMISPAWFGAKASADTKTLGDGTYEAAVTTDSTMFKVAKCQLMVQDGEMTAVLTLSADGFDRLYPGPVDERTDDKTLTYAADDEGRHVFWPVAVSDLDTDITVSVRGTNSGKWYPHTINVSSKSIKKVSDGIKKPSKKLEAEKYLNDFDVSGNIIDEKSNFSDVVVKNGSAYIVPEKDSRNKAISEIELFRPSTGQFKSGWTFSDWSVFTNETHDAALSQAYTLSDSANGKTVTATLSLYKPTASDADINEGKAEVLDSREFTITFGNVSTAVDIYTYDVMTGERVPSTLKVTYKPAKKSITVKPNADGKYEFDPLGRKVTVNVSGLKGYYMDGTNGKTSGTASFTPTRPNEEFGIPVVSDSDAKAKMTLKLVDEDGKPIEIPKTLESGEEFNVDGADTKGQPDQPGEDGKYDVTFRGNTSLRINIKGYLKTFPSVKITEKDQVVTITLKKPRTFHYYLTVQAPEGKPELQNPVVKVYSRNDTKMETPLELKGDGYYEMIEDVGLKVVVTSDNYKDKTWVVSVKDDDDIDIHKTETGFTLTDLASFEFDLSKLKKEVDGMTEGTEPGQFAEGTKAEIQPAIDEAEALLTKEEAKKTEYNSAIKNIQTLIKTAYDEKEVPEKAEVKVIAYTQPGTAAKEMTLNVTPLTGAVADTYQKNRTLGLKNRVTLLDVMVAAHRELYPDFDETNITEDESGTKQYKYFDEGVNGQIGTTTGMMFGNQKKVFRSAYIIDGQKNTKVNGDVASITIKDGDTVSLLSCYYSDPGTALVRFTEPRVTAVAGEKFTLTMEGLIYSDVSFDLNTYPTDWEKMSDVVVTLKNKETGEKFSSVEPSSSNGKMIFNIDEPGIYELDSISSDTYTYFFYPEVRVKVYKRPDAPGVKTNIAKFKVSALKNYTYNGKAKKPAVKVTKDGEKATVKVTYKNNKKIGKATVTIKGTGDYTGTITKTFKILPAKAKIKKANAAKKSVKLTVSILKGGVKYQVSYKNGKKWKTVKSSKTTVTVKKLKSGKKYSFRVRAYKKVGGKTYYGAWSKTKSVKVK